ncbi:hypothetical protein ABE096_22845 [Robertmurraya massiliosenegalensis]|uniref:hypothetical protein n=1 Tax=Robertmurraya TaxID=2837507 RepID=UPI0039A601E5
MKREYTLGKHSSHTFESLCKGMGRSEVHLLTYNDEYLKDAFMTQLAEHFVDEGWKITFIQPLSTEYMLRDLFLSRIYFKQNPHDFPFIQELHKQQFTPILPMHQEELRVIQEQLTIISTKPQPSLEYCEQLVQSMVGGAVGNHLLIMESPNESSLEISFKTEKWAKDHGLTILLTNKIASKDFPTIYCGFPFDYESCFYLHSHYPNLYNLSTQKNIACDFTLNYENMISQQIESHFTLRPANGYCQEA